MATSVSRRIYFSLPVQLARDGIREGLASNHKGLITALADEVKSLGYGIEVFARLGISESPTAFMAWGFGKVDEVMRRCDGAVFLGIPRWIFSTAAGEEVHLGSAYSHYEGALAVTLGLPRLILAEEHLQNRGIFGMQHEDFITPFPVHADASWLGSENFKGAFEAWQRQLAQRRDLFLGYSGSSKGTAQNLKRYLQDLGATVLDWQTDFTPAGNILDQIQGAARRCGAAIFLFTQDDALVGDETRAAPRDNVVFEAGYFSAARGKQRVLIVRETGTKMPADLGGDIYASLADRADISSVEPQVKKFVESL